MARSGRPKSEGIPYPIKPYLTIEQSNWLDRQPNKSQSIANLIQQQISPMRVIKVLDNQQYDDNGLISIVETATQGSDNYDYYSVLDKELVTTDVMGWADSIAIYKFEDDPNGWFYALTNWIEPSDLID
jgi:hypothetical protein